MERRDCKKTGGSGYEQKQECELVTINQSRKECFVFL